jgi:predicted RNase H-like nuclease
VAVCENPSTESLSWAVFPTIEALLAQSPPVDLVALDVPIGLPDRGARVCDLEARQRLGRRKSSVFPAPVRDVLAANSYREACQARTAAEGKRMSIQAWSIVPKIREVDGTLRSKPSLVGRVREVHPELCFCQMAGGQPMAHRKKTAAGEAERRALLVEHFGRAVDDALAEVRKLGCARDDVLDALRRSGQLDEFSGATQ